MNTKNEIGDFLNCKLGKQYLVELQEQLPCKATQLVVWHVRWMILNGVNQTITPTNFFEYMVEKRLLQELEYFERDTPYRMRSMYFSKKTKFVSVAENSGMYIDLTKAKLSFRRWENDDARA